VHLILGQFEIRVGRSNIIGEFINHLKGHSAYIANPQSPVGYEFMLKPLVTRGKQLDLTILKCAHIREQVAENVPPGLDVSSCQTRKGVVTAMNAHLEW
jgi:hypothetical protein